MSVDQLINNFGGLTEEYAFYNGEVILHYEPRAHQYLLAKDGDLIPQEGVTSICHIIDKSHALVPWACKMMAAKLLAEGTIRLPDGQVIARQMSAQEFESLVLSSKDAHKEHLEDAGEVGHIAHAWIERYIKAILAYGEDSVQVQETLTRFPDDERATNCCLASLEWMRAHNVRWISTERKIYSRLYGYAGTMDGLCKVDSCTNHHCCKSAFKDRLTISDWKTSNYLYIEYLLQTSAYMQAYNEEERFIASCQQRRHYQVTDRWVIRLGKEEGEVQTWHAPAEDFVLDFNSFHTALTLKRNTEAITKRVKDREAATRNTIKAERRAIKETAELAEKKRKAEERARIKAEKEVALRIQCAKAENFKGTRYPKCNGGSDPCETCLAKYIAVQKAKYEPHTITRTDRLLAVTELDKLANL